MKKKYYKTLILNGKTHTIECDNHSYRWSGKMPRTSEKLCVFCGKLQDSEKMFLPK